MMRQIFLGSLCTVVGYCLPALAHAQRLTPSTGEQVVVLHNGNILRGTVQQSGDRWRVRRQGIESFIEASQVEFICSDLDDAYRRKRAALRSRSVEAVLELSRWCSRHGLVGYAAETLTLVQQSSSTDPRLERMRRLILADAARRRENSVATTRDGGPAGVARTSVRFAPSRELVQEFRDRVQTSLVRSCGAGTCHAIHTPTVFRLHGNRDNLSRSMVLARRNAASVLEYIVWNDVDASPLLTTKHSAEVGKAADVRLGADDRRTLVRWLTRVADERAGRTSPASQVALTAADATGEKPKSQPSEFGGRELRDSPSPGASEHLANVTTVGSRLARRRKDSSVEDPFDPDIFNRRYHPDRYRSAIDASAESTVAGP